MKPLSVDQAFLLLCTHGPEHAKRRKLDLPLKSTHPELPADESIPDLPGTLTVQTTSIDPLEQVITITIEDLNLRFTHTGSFDFANPNPFPLHEWTNKKGTLYVCGVYPAAGPTDFTAQQFPSYEAATGGKGYVPGRVVVYTGPLSLRQFITDDDNYVSGVVQSERTEWRPIH
ncbi:uncharacterized protein FIBRA_07772 [Fibroporia radiculosa]|uniref:Uncharacterized protein n=1 Tax=Fibroporia radiculosa TaxID=599839 RepID=J4GVK7_9APHY|nr:uncharacterized protein FIBRA_07772 [Fibroporia radiculosa]CCM05545.1 predicted protein [Fibroporia radiculosa]